MPHKTQVDLLRVLERRELRRLGGEEPISLNVRLVVATNRDVDELVAEGRMRSELYYRLGVVRLRLPPLRERRDDIPQVVRHFLERAALQHNREIKQVAGSAMRVLRDFAWPGNLRQLRNIVERLVVTVERPTIQVDDLPGELLAEPPSGAVVSLDDAVREAETAAILAALAQCNQHRERTAKLLGVSVRTLHYKMNRYGLQ
jgi:two-component system NtrC family response regulator